METVLSKLTRDNHGAAVELASIPEKIRGYGHVKEKAITEAKSQEKQLRAIFDNPELAKKYPLNIVSPKSHGFLNSCYANMDHKIKGQGEQFVLINAIDAKSRDIDSICELKFIFFY